MSNARKTWVTRHTIELRGEYSRVGLTQRIKKAFASGLALRHEDLWWVVDAFDVESGTQCIWRASLREVAKPERRASRGAATASANDIQKSTEGA